METTMKARVFSVLMAWVLVLTMVIGTGTIANAASLNINGATASTTYEGYRLLTATTSSDGSVTYSLNEKYEEILLQEATAASGQQVSTLAQLLTFLDSHRESGNTTATESPIVRTFADNVYKRISSMEADGTFHGGSNSVDHATQQGYWLLAQKTGADATTAILFALANSDMTINVKQGTPEVHKKVMGKNDTAGTATGYQDAADYDIGDDIPYMITGTISNQIKTFDKYTFKFKDTLPKGLTIDTSSIVVQIEKVAPNAYAQGINATNKVVLTANDDYTVSTAADGDATILTVDVHNLLSLVKASGNNIDPGDTVVVTCNAKLNQNATIGAAGNVNNVTLTYSHNPYKDEDQETTTRNAKVYFYALQIFKTGKDKNALSGAGFTIYKQVDGEFREIAKLDGSGAVYSNGFEGTATLGAQGEVANSTFTFNGLDAGTYKIVETTVPDGYRKAEDVEFTINTSFTNQNSAAAALASLKVESTADFVPMTDGSGQYTGIIATTIHNSSDLEIVLPNTGGYGIAILVGGVAAFSYGLVTLFKRKRYNEE